MNRHDKKWPERLTSRRYAWCRTSRGLASLSTSQLIWRGIVAYVIASAVATSAEAGTSSTSTAGNHQSPRILVLRGVFEVFSLGMNDLARKLQALGYDATATSWSLALFEVDVDDSRPVVVVGHSLGGRACGWVSRELRTCGRRVPLIIILDANLWQSIPDNVDRCVHLHVTNSLGIFCGSPVNGEASNTSIVNWDVSKGQASHIEGVNHFNIDATDWVHQLVIDEIARTFPPPMNPQNASADMAQRTAERGGYKLTNASSGGTPTLQAPHLASAPRHRLVSPVCAPEPPSVQSLLERKQSSCVGPHAHFERLTLQPGWQRSQIRTRTGR